ncbi:MAG TPA: GNAT family N-acetyltransferase [Tepidisphaeraceae bacterium]|jgi:ribosomal protein S18 acetylase RimI-like enzyme
MDLRPATPADLDAVDDIDAVLESTQYLHVDFANDPEAEITSAQWKIEQRPLREKRIEANPISDDLRFTLKQVITGGDEGVALVFDHEDTVVALLLAQPRPDFGTMELIDLRVDYDYRRQGLATVLLFRLIELAREAGCRAVSVSTISNNAPASVLLRKLGFELSGLDTRRRSNHDLVKEAATLIWYYEIV